MFTLSWAQFTLSWVQQTAVKVQLIVILGLNGIL